MSDERDYEAAGGDSCDSCGNSPSADAGYDDWQETKRVEKTMNVCNAKSISSAKKEIAKCVVRCSNCHRVKTHCKLDIFKATYERV